MASVYLQLFLVLVAGSLLSRVYAFWKLVKLYRHIPGYRVVLSPLHPLTYLFSAKLKHVPGLFVSQDVLFSIDFSQFERFQSEVFVVVSMYPLGARLVVANLKAIKTITTARTTFVKPMGRGLYAALNTFGNNLLSSEGQEWTKHRKVAAPAFSERNMALVWDEAARVVGEAFRSWNHAKEVRVPDVRELTLKMALHVLSGSAFGRQVSWEDNEPIPAGHTMSLPQALKTALDRLILKIFVPPAAWGSAEERYQMKVAGPAGRGWLGGFVKSGAVGFSEMHNYMLEMIEERRANGLAEGRQDLFTNLLRACDEDSDAGLTMLDVTGDMFIFLLAGHETSAHALAFMFGLLALEQEEQERLRKHITDVIGDREPAYSDFGVLHRVVATFNEALRLYPTVVTVPKTCASDSTIHFTNSIDPANVSKTTVSLPIVPGTIIGLHAAGLHYNPRYFKDPEAFRPERWLEDPAGAQDAFMAFSMGMRSCIGRRFSEVEVVAIATLILQRYSITIDADQFPDIPGEAPLQRRRRLLQTKKRITVYPLRVPLVFTRR